MDIILLVLMNILFYIIIFAVLLVIGTYEVCRVSDESSSEVEEKQ